MASVAVLIGGALANVLAFTGSSCLFSRLSNDSIEKERKRYDLVIEQERIDFINKQLRLEKKAETKFIELNDAMREYYEVFGH